MIARENLLLRIHRPCCSVWTPGIFDFVLQFEAVEWPPLMTSAMKVINFTTMRRQGLTSKCHKELHVFMNNDLSLAYHWENILGLGDFEIRGRSEEAGPYCMSLTWLSTDSMFGYGSVLQSTQSGWREQQPKCIGMREVLLSKGKTDRFSCPTPHKRDQSIKTGWKKIYFVIFSLSQVLFLRGSESRVH